MVFVYTRKASKAKERSELTLAKSYVKKAAFYNYLVWGLIAGFVLVHAFIYMTLIQQITIVFIVTFLFIFVLPSHTKDLEGILKDKKPEDEKEESYVGKSYLYIARKVILSWGSILLFFAFMACAYSLFPDSDQDIKPSSIPAVLGGFALIFVYGVPVCLVVAVWKYCWMKRKLRLEQNKADCQILGHPVQEKVSEAPSDSSQAEKESI
ncbi:MAG: hypothetical protein ACYTER_07335 [Planctomycetota bacterium]|jgi:hypothetical protein